MPTPRYVELETVRRAVNIREGDDIHDDDLLFSAILAAEQQIDGWCGRPFTLDAAVSARTYRPTGFEYLFVGDIATTDGLIVETGGLAGEWSPLTIDSDFYLDTAPDGRPSNVLVSASRWPEQAYRTVRVTARWGWLEVPAVVRHAAQIQAVRLFKRKDSPEGVAGWDIAGAAVRVARLDPDVTELLRPYMRQTSIA